MVMIMTQFYRFPLEEKMFINNRKGYHVYKSGYPIKKP